MRKRSWPTVAEMMEAVTRCDQIDAALWASPGYADFCKTFPYDHACDHAPVVAPKKSRKRRTPSAKRCVSKQPLEKTPPETAIAAGFSQIFTEHAAIEQDGSLPVYVNLDTLYCFVPATPEHPARSLVISVECREYHPRDPTGRNHVAVTAEHKIITSSRDFYEAVAAFQETLEDAHSTKTAMFPGNLSIRYKRGRFDPLHTRDEVSHLWWRVQRLLEHLARRHSGGRGDRGDGTLFPWMGKQSVAASYRGDDSSITCQQLCNVLCNTPCTHMTWMGWYQMRSLLECHDRDQGDEEEYRDF